MSARIATGFIIAAAFIALCLLGPPWLIYGVLQAGALIGIYEMLRMTAPRAPLFDVAGAWVGGSAVTAVAYFAPHALPAAILAAPVVVLGTFLLRPRPIETAATRMGGAMVAVFYVGLLFAAVIFVSTRAVGEFSGRALLLLGAVVFMGDTGAYFAGRSLGRHKLHPSVSPNKTVEGSLGGLVGSLLGALLVKLIVAPGITWGDVVAIAVPCAVLGQAGDLAESLFKRSYGVKDSGGLLPGHGGVLDRVDGLLFAAPYLIFYMHHVSPVVLA